MSGEPIENLDTCQNLLGPNDIYPPSLNMSNAKVKTTSVFHKCCLVKRFLSLDEVLGIFDVPKSIQGFFKSKKDLPFVGEPPLKILAQVGMAVSRTLNNCVSKLGERFEEQPNT